MIVWTNGGYDCIHPGHYNLLQYCRYMAGKQGKVIVGIDSDEKMRKTKGDDRPIFSQEERKEHLLSLKYGIDPLINEIYTFNSPAELYGLIKTIQPDVMIIGDDWKGKPVIGEDLIKPIFYPKIKGISTTEIIQRCQKKS